MLHDWITAYNIYATHYIISYLEVSVEDTFVVTVTNAINQLLEELPTLGLWEFSFGNLWIRIIVKAKIQDLKHYYSQTEYIVKVTYDSVE